MKDCTIYRQITNRGHLKDFVLKIISVPALAALSVKSVSAFNLALGVEAGIVCTESDSDYWC